MKKFLFHKIRPLVIFTLILLIILSTIVIVHNRTLGESFPKLPPNWSLKNTFEPYTKIIDSKTGKEYYAYIVIYRGNMSDQAWLITDTNRNPVKDRNLYYSLAETAEAADQVAFWSSNWSELEQIHYSINHSLKILKLGKWTDLSKTLLTEALHFGSPLKASAKTALQTSPKIAVQISLTTPIILGTPKEIAKDLLKSIAKEGAKSLVKKRAEIGVIAKLHAFNIAIRYMDICADSFNEFYRIAEKYKNGDKTWNTDDGRDCINAYIGFWDQEASFSYAADLMHVNFLVVGTDIVTGIFRIPISGSDIEDICSIIKGISPINEAFDDYKKQVVNDGKYIYFSEERFNILEKDNPYYGVNYAYILFNDLLNTNPSGSSTTTGTLNVDSEPSGAKVYINEVYKGITPLTLHLSSGQSNINTYEIKVVKSGYEQYYSYIDIRSNSTKQLNIKLTKLSPPTPKTGALSVSSDPKSALVIINNYIKGTTPIDIPNLKPGKYLIELRLRGYKTISDSITISSNKTTKYYGKFYPVESIISISSVPNGAQIFINGVFQGVTPSKLKLKHGTYKLELIKNGFDVKSMDIKVSGNKTITIPLSKTYP